MGIQDCTTLTKENSSCPAGLPGLLIQQTHFSDLHRYQQKYKKTYAVHWFCRTILKSKRLQTTQMSINRKLVVQTSLVIKKMKDEELSSGDRIKIQKNSTVCYHFLRKEKHKYILFFEWGKRSS